ncbi:MAG: amidohydrolase family protein [Immundisolibacteraceae bacterium]|nr:amidohydrolase family protein [Immundisolibacteraceae bacterium]
MSYDLLIKNGTVVDGTGAERFVADVAVNNGMVVEIGKLGSDATEVIDATGKIVCPGFVDPHTHYDAQISWDTLLSSSSEHGVTTVVMGNCGVGVAPCRVDQREMTKADLITVEGMSAESLTAGINWQWETFSEYMDVAAASRIAINTAFLVPLAPFRTFVLGEDASERGANDKETEQLTQMLSDAMQAGAFGFSLSPMNQHIGWQGKPLATRLASDQELKAYSNVLRDLGRGIIEVAVVKKIGTLGQDEYDVIDLLLAESQRPVSWLAVFNRKDQPEAAANMLAKADPLIKRGAIPQVLSRPLTAEFSLSSNPLILADTIAGQVLFNRPVEEVAETCKDPEFRQQLRDNMAQGAIYAGQFPSTLVQSVKNPQLEKYVGKTIAEISAGRDTDDFDTFFDLALEDNLAMRFVGSAANNDWERIPELINDPRTMIGLSDGGAHCDMLCEAGYATFLLGYWVREKQVMTLEYAIKRITSEPADIFGLKDRGRLQVGNPADIVIFDQQTIGSDVRPTTRYDLPAGAPRLYSQAKGIDRVIVNGASIYHNGEPTGVQNGKVLRSGDYQ